MNQAVVADVAQQKELRQWLTEHGLPGDGVEFWNEVRPSTGLAFRGPRTVFVKIDNWPETGTLSIPRMNNVVAKSYLLGRPETKLTVQPEPRRWLVSLPSIPPVGTRPVIVLETGVRPHVPVKPQLVTPDVDGTIRLHARQAITHGATLRFEPQPHKNTLGYWSDPKDWAQWYFEVKTAATYSVHILQGCGAGHGGSEATMNIRLLADLTKAHALPEKPPIRFTVVETGHFQNFVARTVGTLTFKKPGLYTLEVRPGKLAAGAVMDLRLVLLTRNAK